MFNLSEQFKLKIQEWGLAFLESQEGFYLYVELEDGKQAYRFFSNETEAEKHIKDGLFFGYQGLWDKYINKPKSYCEI